MSFPHHSRPGDYRFASSQPPVHPQIPPPLSPLTTTTLHSRRPSFIHQLPPPTHFPASPSTDPAKWSTRPTTSHQPSRPWSPPGTSGGRRGDVELAPMGDHHRMNAGAASYWNRTSMNGRGDEGYTMNTKPSIQQLDQAYHRPQTAPSQNQSTQPTHIITPAPTSSVTSTNRNTNTRSLPPKSRARHSPSPSRSPSPTSPASHPKQKKRRVALSCAECAKRKQKCNRETPCQHCVARRVPELCVPYTRPPDSDPKKGNSNAQGSTSVTGDGENGEGRPKVTNMLPTLSVRVSRIEALLNAMVNRVGGVEGKALDDWRINHAPASTPPPLRSRHQSNDTYTAQNVSPSPSSPTADLPDVREQAQGSPDIEVEGEEGANLVGGVGMLDRDSSIRNPLPQSMLSSESIPQATTEVEHRVAPAEHLDKLFRDCGISPEKIKEIIRDLPEQGFANQLVEWFFSKINHLRYPLDEYAFRQNEIAIDKVYTTPRLELSSVLALPLIYIVLALSMRVAPDEWEYTEEQKKTTSLQMYWHSKNAMMLASAVQAEHIQLVEAKIQTALYLILMHERRLAEGWQELRSALAIGQSIGLHRDGKKLGYKPYETEYRRWLWSYLIHADATYSCLLGRPTAINLDCANTLPPSNIDIKDLVRGHQVEPRHDDEPTFATYVILRRRLGEIVAKVTQHFQRLHGQTPYRDVEELDAEFKALVEDLPSCYRMVDPDKSYDKQPEMWFLVTHRYYIQTEILHFIIILHRPWLLRWLRSRRYAQSRESCFEAAITDFKIRQAFKKDCPDFFETLLGGSFREFNVAMIAGISIIIDPHSNHVNDMRAIVDSFMKMFPHDPKADDFSQKEALIIHTLHRRAQEMEYHRASQLSHDRKISISSSVNALHRPQSNISSERTAHSNESLSGHELSVGHGNSTYGSSPVKGGAWNRQSMESNWMGSGMAEEDHSQQLLDHWIMSNTSFGPGAIGPIPPAGMINGFAPMLPMQPMPMMPPTVPDGLYGDPTWVDPTGMGQPMMAPTDPALGGMIGAPAYAVNNGGYAANANSAQYWDTLIDGIVGGVGMQGMTYDVNGR